MNGRADPRTRDLEIRPATLDELVHIRDDLPPGLERGLILPLPPGTLPVERAVGIPQLSQRFTVTASGLAVPSTPPVGFADLAVSYLSLSADFGREIAEPDIVSALSTLPLRQVLWILGQVTHRADRFLGNTDGQIRLARSLLPEGLIGRAVNLVRAPERAVVSPQVSLGLALRALVHCREDGEVGQDRFDDLVRTVGVLLLALGDHLPGGSDREALTLDVARNDLFFRLWGHTEWYAEAHELLFRTLPTLTDHPDWVDADAALRAAFGVGLEDFWALSVAVGVASFGREEPVRFPLHLPDATIPRDAVEGWTGAWSVDLEDARRLATKDLATPGSWSFAAFYDRPLLDAGGGLHFAPRPHFVAQKAGPTGMFWALARALKAQGIDHERWARLFGHAVELQARRAIGEHVGDPSRLWDEDLLKRRWGSGKVCDLIALYPDAWVAFEFVHRSPTKATQATGEYEDLLRDIRFAAAEKLEQVDDALDRGLNAEAAGPARIFPVVVVGAHFPGNPLVTDALASELDRLGTKVLGRDPRCRPPAVIDLFELRNLLGAAAASGRVVPDLLDEWLGSSLGNVGFRTWLTREGPGIAGPRDRDWVVTMSQLIFGRSPRTNAS